MENRDAAPCVANVRGRMNRAHEWDAPAWFSANLRVESRLGPWRDFTPVVRHGHAAFGLCSFCLLPWRHQSVAPTTRPDGAAMAVFIPDPGPLRAVITSTALTKMRRRRSQHVGAVSYFVACCCSSRKPYGRLAGRTGRSRRSGNRTGFDGMGERVRVLRGAAEESGDPLRLDLVPTWTCFIRAWSGSAICAETGFGRRGTDQEVAGSRTRAMRALSAVNLTAGTPTWTTGTGVWHAAIFRRRRFDATLRTGPAGRLHPRHHTTRRGAARSTKPVGLSELRFVDRFDGGDEDDVGNGETAHGLPGIELHPLGRVENCYAGPARPTSSRPSKRSAALSHRPRPDRTPRHVDGCLRHLHLGLKHPDFSWPSDVLRLRRHAPFLPDALPNFVKVGDLPRHQELALHMLDSVDYAQHGRSARHRLHGRKGYLLRGPPDHADAMRNEGLQLVNLVSRHRAYDRPGDTTRTDAADRRLRGQGLDRAPRSLRFVTWTLKYSTCHWLRVLGLERHYARAELAATLNDDGSIDVAQPLNITAFALMPPPHWAAKPRLRIAAGGRVAGTDGAPTPIRSASEASATDTRATGGVVLDAAEGRWVFQNHVDDGKTYKKAARLAGPDRRRLHQPFLCVRGTGRPWHPKVHAWSEANLRRFADEWNRYSAESCRSRTTST